MAQFASFSFWETLLSVFLLALLSGIGLLGRCAGAGAAACLLSFVALGILLASLPKRNEPLAIERVLEGSEPHQGDPVRVHGWVREPPQRFPDADRFVLETESLFRGTPAHGGVQVSVYREPDEAALELHYGRRIEFLAKLRRPRNFGNPGSFDWVRFLNKQGIDWLASVRPGTPILEHSGQRGSRLEAWLWAARTSARERLQALLQVPEAPLTAGAGVLSALLLGDRAAVDRTTKTAFQRTGAYHALVISGLHIGALAFAILGILRLLMVPRPARALCTLGIVGAYALVAGGDVPVARAAWMLAAYLAATLLYRQRRALNALALTAMGFLAFEPELLFDAGFQMSFLAVGLIAAIAVPFLERTLEPYRLALSDIWNLDRDLHLAPDVAHHRVALRNWLEPLSTVTRLPRSVVGISIIGPLRVLVWAAELFVVSFVIQAGLALPMAIHFQRVSWGGLSANVAIMPLLFLAVPAGLLALVTGSSWLMGVAEHAAGAMTAVVEFHARHLPVDLRVPPPPLWLACLFGFCLLLVALGIENRSRWRWASDVALLFSLALLIAHPFPHQFTPGRLELSALDVGQGESLLLALPDGRTMLMDGGGLPDYGGTVERTIDIGEAVVSPYLWSRSIKRLDVVAISHADADHMGGIPAVLENFSVGEVWVSAASLADDREALLRVLAHGGLPLVALEAGDTRRLGDVVFNVLGPKKYPSPSASRNDRSLVLRARYGAHSFLLTGDIEKHGEALLVEQDVLERNTVLKVAHHGSRTSSQGPFLERVRPMFALISAGFNGPFGHPHRAVLDRLLHTRATVLRTDLEGLVTVASDGRRLFVSTYRREKMR